MNIQIVVHAPESAKDVVKRLAEKNISGKLDAYLKKFDKADAVGKFEIKTETNKKWLFDTTLQASLDGKNYHYHREDYSNLDDLINNLFDHLKEQLSEK